MKFFEKTFLLFLCCVLFYNARAQLTPARPFPPEVQELINADTSGKIYIVSINIMGNKKTKDYIIQREMRFAAGDSIKAAALDDLVEVSRSLIYNTTLFTGVTITPQRLPGNAVSLDVEVKEKWYVYPTPQFQLVDRNLNEWLKTYKGDLNRVIYGAKFAHYNFSGRRDQLRIYLLNGYARNISFSYSAPYSNSALTEGYAISAGYTENREIPYATSYDNKILNFRNGAFVRKNIATSIAYIIRRGHFERHVLGLSYTYVKVNDSLITKYNPGYFNSSSSAKGIIDLSYAFQNVKADNISYPLKGKVYGFTLSKRGLGFTGGVNAFIVDGYYNKYIPHGKNWYSSIQLIGKIKAPFRLAYINQRALGFGDFYLRGLEYYVIDGVAAAVAKYTLKKKIISFNIPVPFKIRTVPKIPVAFYAKTFADVGTSYSGTQFDSRLNNRFLYTAGIGLDILTLYDINLRLEYSFNQLGENGLFLHAKGGF
jgi:outer membrane protein assembly factor BamA